MKKNKNQKYWMIQGGECRNLPGKVCYYIHINNELGKEIAYAEEVATIFHDGAGGDDTEQFDRLLKAIDDQLSKIEEQ